jgi:ferredoxin
MSQRISREGLRALVAQWLASGTKVIGPVEVKPGLVQFEPIASADALILDRWVRPANSIKEAVFPRHEVLYSYRIEGGRIELTDAPEPAAQVVIGAHPCDAAALPVLDRIFNWDFRDEAYNRRRAATTVIALACDAHDSECFCTSVGLDPASERGSDVLLRDRGEDGYEVRFVSERGSRLFAGASLQAGTDRTEAASAAPPPQFDPAEIAAFAKSHFDDPSWAARSLACIGCGACAYTCPVCHCFDIVDEGNRHGGVRARNWDSCQFPLFTLHASGHNPRHAQGDRQRQRIYHKFVMYPEKFGEILCTGCGNCARNCPAGLGVLPVLTEIRDGKHL